MKTFKTILGTVLVTVILGIVGLFGTGLVKVEKVEQQHNVAVMVDGKEVAKQNFVELYGYTLSVNVNEAYYVGK